MQHGRRLDRAEELVSPRCTSQESRLLETRHSLIWPRNSSIEFKFDLCSALSGYSDHQLVYAHR